MIRLGVIGCGAVARYCHVPALRRISGITVAAVADPDATARTRLAAAAGAKAYDSAQAVIERNDIDAVLISVPTHLHAGVAIAAAKAGKAFYLEKPVATEMHDAVDVLRAASDAGVPAAIGFNRRAHPHYMKAKSLIEAGSIGEIHAIHTVFSEPAPKDGIPGWKLSRATGGGVLLDLASHHVDLVRWLTGCEVTLVSASTTTIASESDTAALSMSLNNGAKAQCYFSLVSAYADHVEVIGSRATLRIDRHKATLTMMSPKRVGYGAREQVIRAGSFSARQAIRKLLRSSQDPSYHGSLTAFVAQVRGERAPLASLDDGLRSLAIVLAAEESALTGHPATLKSTG